MFPECALSSSLSNRRLSSARGGQMLPFSVLTSHCVGRVCMPLLHKIPGVFITFENFLDAYDYYYYIELIYLIPLSMKTMKDCSIVTTSFRRSVLSLLFLRKYCYCKLNLFLPILTYKLLLGQPCCMPLPIFWLHTF